MKVRINKSVLSEAVKKIVKQQSLQKMQLQFTQQELNNIKYHVKSMQDYLRKIVMGQDQLGNVKWQLQKLQDLFDIANDRTIGKYEDEQQYATL